MPENQIKPNQIIYIWYIQYIYIYIYMNKEDLALNNQQWLMSKPNQTKSYIFNIYV